jgi:RNA polymerase-binding transcription factor DksA
VTGSDIRARLVAERAEVERRIEAAIADLGRIIAAGVDVATDDEHDPDGIGLALERAHQVAVVQRAQDHLRQIDEALTRLVEGTYGRCVVCGELIPQARLAARPTATTCVGCR